MWRITILGPAADLARWLQMRTADGQVGFISGSGHAVTERRGREANFGEEEAGGDSEGGRRLRRLVGPVAQNEYETKLNLVNTLTLTPLQRVYAASRLKQNLDAELKVCRSQYESRLRMIEGE